MKLNRDVLINAIVKHQMTFFKLLDYIDNHDGSLEFPEHRYIALYNNEICSNTDDSNIHYHLSTASLIENGVFIHNDKNTGMITIERLIVDLLRFLDIKRAKELTHFDLEQLRKQMVSVTAEVMHVDITSQDYKDAMASFNILMSEVHSIIKENVSGLTVQVESIAKEYKVYDSGAKDISVFDLYEKVSTLYTRYVLPCYEFINPDMEMVNTKSFSKAIQDIIDYHSGSRVKQYDVANGVQFRKTAITSYYKDIAALVRKLEQFSNHLEQERNYFLAIESAFSELIDSITPLRHGKQRNKYLTSNADIFSKFTSLDGLSNRKLSYSSKFNWREATTRLRFKEYLIVINDQGAREKKKILEPLPPNKSITQQRQMAIAKLIYNADISDYSQDIHRFIYDYLKNELHNFELADVLYGIEALLPMLDQNRITTAFKRSKLTDDKYYLDYILMEYHKEILNV